MLREPRDVSIHLFRWTPEGLRFLMLRRIAARGGFWQGVTGAPLAGETDLQAAAREVREETAFVVALKLIPAGEEYAYRLRPEQADRWVDVYGPDVTSISVVTFGAEAPADRCPILDPNEHDGFMWCSYEEADSLLDWPIEKDAHEARRRALRALRSLLVSPSDTP
jgi:8-oxo-dGTP pyrophosphatase MutT (NUDIX family)